MLSKRGITKLDKKKYREIFTFPVKEYYEEAGIDILVENFEKPAIEFIELYYEHLPQTNLFPAVNNTLEQLNKLGKHQAILSAMEHDSLIKSLKEKKVFNWFDLVSGINDHYAHSKLEMGRDLIGQMGFLTEEILLVGDTLHDFEVGSQLNLDVVLIANGHQSKSRLLEFTVNVLEDIEEIFTILE